MMLLLTTSIESFREENRKICIYFKAASCLCLPMYICTLSYFDLEKNFESFRSRKYNKRGRKLGYRSETTKDDNAICEVGTKFNNKIFEK